MAVREMPVRTERPGKGLIVIGALLFLLIGGRWIASFLLEYEWWKEMGQVGTWESILAYSFLPQTAAALAAFAAFWVAHARGMKQAGTRLGAHPMYAKLATLALLGLAVLVAAVSLDAWTIVSFYGSQRAGLAANAWRDPIFGHALSFYLFELPFYQELLGVVLGITFWTALVYWAAARGWSIARESQYWREEGFRLDLQNLRLTGGLEPFLLRFLVAVFLLGMAARSYLARYDFLNDDHGFLVGIDYVAHHIQIPLLWVSMAAFGIAAVCVFLGRWKFAAGAVLLSFLRLIVPPLVSAAYVKPNELTLQRPYIQNHIRGTRAAYGFDQRLQEVQFPAKLESTIDVAKNRPLLENVRLWDWRAFHDTISQIQALRQYYVFPDTDVDRYMVDGEVRQVMLAPRELDIRQLPDARANWINGHFIYTHGYGLVLAEANRITPNGQPVLFIQDAPPKVFTKSFQLKRPEIYYGESVHEPVFVDTKQPEFNYPSGSENVQTRYEGHGGIPINSFGMRAVAALAYADRNVLLTNYLTPQSRMMIRRNVRERVQTLAAFIDWDSDPYLVITPEGRLVWIIDGYTSSSRHPYSRSVRMEESGSVNYIRNSVKATVDAYDGHVNIYIFDTTDPIIRAFRAIFPALFQPAEAMPADLRAHTRYPEVLFRRQAEIYRTYHMQDPEAFYNKEDLWDLARDVHGQTGQPEAVQPTYIVGTLPGQSKPEFLLLQPFTPRSKDNLIGMMVARCDGAHLGEMVVLQLSKQSLIYGPLQVEARIDSDQTISKDLSLWNQQGSQVLRGQMLTLPIDDTFLYVKPIYIQAAQAKMPQLKKVVLAMGNTLIYRDTYEQALAELRGGPAPSTVQAPAATLETQTTAPPPATGTTPRPTSEEAAMQQVREHLRKYRELSSQGRWSEAGRELEAVEKIAGK